MFGTPGATERHVDARIPGTTMGIEMIEFHDTERRAVRPRLQDPGQVVLVLLVRDVEALLARLTAAKVPVLTPGGKPVPARDGSRAVLIADPDGRPVELRQPATPPASAPPDGEIVGGRLAITVADLDTTVAVYRTALGFDVTAPTRFAVDPFVRTLTGVRGEVRRSVATSPGNGQVFELIEFRGVERTPLQTRLQDPGSVRLQVMVRGINEVTAALTKAGATIVSDGGVRASLPPNFWGLTVRGARQPVLVAARAVRRLRAGRPTAVPAATSTSNVPAVPAISGPVSGPARMYPDPAVSVVPGAAQVEDFPYLTEEFFVSGTPRRAVHDADHRAAAEGSRAVQRHRRGGGAARRRPVAHLRVVARLDPDAQPSVRRDRPQPGEHRAAQDFQRRALRVAGDRAGPDQRDPRAGGTAGEERRGPVRAVSRSPITLMGTSASSGTVRSYFPAMRRGGCPTAGRSSTASC